MSGFEKRHNFAQIGDFELVYCFESTVIELHALCFASLAASVLRYARSKHKITLMAYLRRLHIFAHSDFIHSANLT